MSDSLKIALAKLLGKDASDLDVPVGTHKVDEVVTIHVVGEVTRRKDVEYTPTVSVPLKATLALLLSRMGFQRDAAAEILIEAMTAAMKGDALAEAEIEARMADVDDAMKRVSELTAALPKATRKGATSVKGSVEVIVSKMAAAA